LNDPMVKETVVRYAVRKGYVKPGEVKMRLEDALLFLAERDDGAEKKDGAGFNAGIVFSVKLWREGKKWRRAECR